MRGSRRLALVLALLLAAFTFSLADGDFLARPAGASFRLRSYNPYWDAIFRTGLRRYNRSAEFERVLAAVRPDVVCLQEIDPDRARRAVIAIFDRVLPLPAGQQWTVASGADNVIVSRFPLLWSQGEVVQGSGDRGMGHTLAMIDLPDEDFATDVLVGTHFTSGGTPDEIASRTDHADRLVSAVRAARADGVVPHGTPVVIAGDLNTYNTDPRRHLHTLIHGDVADEAAHGPDGSLDPGRPMADLLPVHNSTSSDTWTWRDDTQQFDPFALDRVLYSGSVLDSRHSFVLNTAIMTDTELALHELEAGDIALNLSRGVFDHLPLVADFVVR